MADLFEERMSATCKCFFFFAISLTYACRQKVEPGVKQSRILVFHRSTLLESISVVCLHATLMPAVLSCSSVRCCKAQNIFFLWRNWKVSCWVTISVGTRHQFCVCKTARKRFASVIGRSVKNTPLSLLSKLMCERCLWETKSPSSGTKAFPSHTSTFFAPKSYDFKSSVCLSCG